MNEALLDETLRRMQSKLFATKDSIPEAIQYAYDVIDSGGSNKAAMYTVVHVLMNTIAEEVRHITMLGKGDETGGE
jgi:hypothetical protein